MALIQPAKVAGSHLALYESYYKLVDPKNLGQVGPKEAADFLKKSQLNEAVLIKIWDIADPNARGYLDKAGMFVALKLCALAQQNLDLTPANIFMDIPPPKMGDLSNTGTPAPCPQSIVAPPSNCWSITPVEKERYDKLFQSLEPVNGFVSGNKVKGVLMDSKLPLETLGKIWDLADMDRDGRLNQHEFIIAMHLVYKALEKHAIPSTLPAELMEENIKLTSQRKVSTTSDPLAFNAFPAEVKKGPVCDWVVSAEDQKIADKLFKQADKDLDGFVSGLEIKDIFLQSRLPQQVLAHIWSLCDISQCGKLNNEQFALSMWLIKQKLSNVDLPSKLTPEMIPPSFRKKDADTNLENNNVCSYTNPELEMINKDIIEIIREKLALEQDISQKEADIKIKNGEIKSLQSELDTLAATLRQLDSQKGEAQKRLNDLKTQVDKLRQQAEDQEATLLAQEEEVNNKRQEMESIKITEQNLEMQQNECKNKLNASSMEIQNTQLRISQLKAEMTQLEEQQSQIIDAITQYDGALAAGDASHLSDSLLSFKAKIESSLLNDEDIMKIRKKSNDNENAFNNNANTQDSFSAFGDNFNSGKRDPFEGEFKTDAAHDAFSDNKPFDPFNDDVSLKNSAADNTQVKDPFGEDPFAALHAPVKPETPNPALPTKKSKQPPPRPAPPRSAKSPQPPGSVSPSPISPLHVADPFSDKGTSHDSDGSAFGFADFANFPGQ